MNNVTNKIFDSQPATSGLGRIADRHDHDGYTVINIEKQQTSKQYKGSNNKLNVESMTSTWQIFQHSGRFVKADQGTGQQVNGYKTLVG